MLNSSLNRVYYADIDISAANPTKGKTDVKSYRLFINKI